MIAFRISLLVFSLLDLRKPKVFLDHYSKLNDESVGLEKGSSIWFTGLVDLNWNCSSRNITVRKEVKG